LAGTFEQISAFLNGLSLKHKLLLAGGAVAVGLTLWVFVGLIDKAKYVTLYSGLRPADAQSMGPRLAAKNIPYEISADGSSVLVPSERLDTARLETASQGLPRNARMGFELFDTPNWAGSDFSEKVNYQRALEGELERTLQTLSDVEAVRVHLVLPRESLFTEQEHEAKAAVIVKAHGGTLSKDALQAIPEAVARAVATTITGALRPVERTALASRRPRDPAAYDRFLRANYELAQRTPRAVRRAIDIIPSGHRASWRIHRVVIGETLAEIAHRYSTASGAITAANRSMVDPPEPGDLLAIPTGYQVARSVVHHAKPVTSHRASRRAVASSARSARAIHRSPAGSYKTASVSLKHRSNAN